MRVIKTKKYQKQIKHLDSVTFTRLVFLIKKIVANPSIGKPLKYYSGERVIRLKPFRLVYSYKDDVLYLLKFEHRSSVY